MRAGRGEAGGARFFSTCAAFCGDFCADRLFLGLSKSVSLKASGVLAILEVFSLRAFSLGAFSLGTFSLGVFSSAPRFRDERPLRFKDLDAFSAGFGLVAGEAVIGFADFSADLAGDSATDLRVGLIAALDDLPGSAAVLDTAFSVFKERLDSVLLDAGPLAAAEDAAIDGRPRGLLATSAARESFFGGINEERV
jgi:hypothetical protein